MKSGPAAALAVAVAIGGAVAGFGPLVPTASAQLSNGEFCQTSAPTSPDTRIADAVLATSVSAPTTGPIAILDTGVDGSVPEIGGRIVSPFDATSGGSDASDVEGHGTEIAGLAAGGGGLVLGVSPTSPIMPVRVYNRTGETTAQWIAAGINYAVGAGASVINVSTALAQSDVNAADLALLTRATSDAFNKDVLVVAAVGNTGNGAPVLPASLPHVLGVGASDLTGSRATFSNTGPWVDLVAPASSLVAPVSSGFCPSGYGVANGTSYAAPAVAGAAAIVGQLRAGLSPQQRFDVLRTSAQDIGAAGRDDDTGFGLLDVHAALSTQPSPVASSREVDDDPFYVRGVNAKGHPVLLTRTRKARLADSVSPARDPSDVYPVRLKKGERLVVSATASVANSIAGLDPLIALGLWKPTAGDFDVTNEVTKNELVSTGGFTIDPVLKMVARKTATYFLSVEAPDAYDPEDPTYQAPTLEPYRLTLTKTPPLKPHKPAKKKKKK